MSKLSALRLAQLALKASQLGITVEQLLERSKAEQAAIDRNRRHRALANELGDNMACREVLARSARARGRRFVLSTMAIALFLIGCVEHGRGTTVREAVETFAPSACERMLRCQAEFPFDSLAMCEAELIDRACADGGCDVPFTTPEEEFDACIETFEQFPCVATIPPPNCLEVG